MCQQIAPSVYHLEPAEIRKLFIAAPDFRDRCVLKSLCGLGLRRQELIDLDVRDIDFDWKQVKAREGKEPRPLSPQLCQPPPRVFHFTRTMSMKVATSAVDSMGTLTILVP